MKKIVSIIFLLIFLAGCGSKNYIKQVDIEDSPLQYNYEIHNDFESLIIKIYEVKDQKWTYVEKQVYNKDELKDMMGIEFDENKEISIYLGDYIHDEAMIYTYQTQMENYATGTVASRDRINIKNKKELPFLAYWSYIEDSKYDKTTHSETLDENFLDYDVESDGGFLITLTFK